MIFQLGSIQVFARRKSYFRSNPKRKKCWLFTKNTGTSTNSRYTI